MNTFHSNITSIYGEKGKEWLDELPELVTAISSKLDLRDLAVWSRGVMVWINSRPAA